jgi:hypothetical protein
MNGYLLKPVRKADLIEILASVMPAAAVRTTHSTPGTDAITALTALDSAVDLAVLTRLTTDMGATSTSSRHALIEAYLEQADTWIHDLAVAAKKNDTDRVRTITHTLGSSSALLGAQPLAELLAKAGQAARAGANDLITPVAEVEYEYRLVSMVLQANYMSLTTSEGTVG